MRKKMKFKYFFSLFGIFLGILGSQVEAMEPKNPANLIQSLEVAPFNQERDIADISQIFKGDWQRLEANRPFNQGLINTLLEPWKGDANISKWRMVLRHEGKTIAFVTYYYRTTEKWGSFEVGGIAPEYRGKGLASHFFPLIIKELQEKGANKILLYVKKDNDVALSLYKKFGFGQPEDAFQGKAWLLTKNLE